MDERVIGTAKHSTVEKLLDSFHTAASKSKLSDYFGCFHLQGTFLGTDCQENWSVVEFLNYAKPNFLSGNAWTYIPIKGSRKIIYIPSSSATNNEKKDISFHICTFDELLSSESFHCTCRGSGSAIFDSANNCWLILSYHLTFPIPNDIASNLCSTIAKFENDSKLKQANQAELDFLKELELEEKASKQNNSNQKKGKNKKK